MPEKNAATSRIGGPGASHENRQQPEKSRQRTQTNPTDARSDVSGGGGENDAHHTHEPSLKGRGRS
jgi:hypothetical protein